VAQTDDLAQALAAADEPKNQFLEPHGVGPLLRAYSSPLVHRAVPGPLALRAAALRGRLEWLVPRKRDEALARTAKIRRVDPASADARRYARKRLVDQAVMAELTWRPWDAPRMAAEGWEQVERLRADGRGIVLASGHVGLYVSLLRFLGARLGRFYVSGGHPRDQALPAGRRGLWIATQNRWVEEGGGRFVNLGGSFPILRELLRRGEACWMAADSSGTFETVYAGHPARIASGIGALATETGAAVVPCFCIRRGYGQVALFLDPIEPADFGGPAALTAHVAGVVGDFLLAHPEQVQRPIFDLWEGRVTRLGLAAGAG
jgi:lauroyl/myristoyl acyltransferase